MNLSTPTVIEVGGTRVALGLRWEDLSAKSGREARKEAKAKAKAAGVRYGVIQETPRGLWLVGFGGGDAPGPKVASGSAWLAQTVVRSTLLCHEVSADAYWVAVIDNGVTLDGDQILDGEAAAGRIERALADFNRKSVEPDVWISGRSYPDAAALARTSWKATTIEELLGSSVPAEARFRQLGGLPKALVVAVFALGAMVAALLAAEGIGRWMEQREQAEMAAQAEAARAAAAAAEESVEVERERRIQEAVAQALVRDTGTAEPMEALQACAAVATRMGTTIAGWPVQDIVCDVAGRVATVTLIYPMQRQYRSTAAHLAAAVERMGLGVTLGGTGMDATVLVPLTLENREPISYEQLGTVDGELERLATRGQLVGQAAGTRVVTFELAQPVSIVYVEPGRDQDVDDPSRFVQVPPERGYRSAIVRAQGNALWRMTALPLERRSVSITRVQLLAQERTWQFTVEGNYVAR